jgi:hypothetical protein
MCLLVVGCADRPDYWPTTAYDQAQWARSGQQQRYVFVRDLIRKKALIGLTRQQVHARLGAPSFDDGEANYITYVVKADGGVVHLLDIRFSDHGPAGVVADVFVRRD